MKILQISALGPNDNSNGDTIYGLGDDGLLYWWNAEKASWLLAKE